MFILVIGNWKSGKKLKLKFIHCFTITPWLILIISYHIRYYSTPNEAYNIVHNIAERLYNCAYVALLKRTL